MRSSQFTAGDTVLVRGRGWKGIACRYLGPEMEPNPSEYEAECYECNGTGDAGDDSDEENCFCCEGSGRVLEIDEEPGESSTGRALVVMVGDDHKHVVDFEDLTIIEDEDEICSCGQLGCWSNNNTMGGEQ